MSPSSALKHPHNQQRDRQRKKRRAYRFGNAAEILTMLWLVATGHRILAWRMRNAAGEVDIIARRGQIIIALEVKARLRRDHDELISTRQQQRISHAMQLWLAKHPQFAQYEVRIDALLISANHWPRRISSAWET